LQRGFRAVWNDFRVNVTVPLKDAKDDCFTVCAPASFPFDAACTKERFVNFNLSRKGRLSLTIFDQALPNFCEISINRVAILYRSIERSGTRPDRLKTGAQVAEIYAQKCAPFLRTCFS